MTGNFRSLAETALARWFENLEIADAGLILRAVIEAWKAFQNEHQALRAENAQLKREVQQLRSVVGRIERSASEALKPLKP